MVIACKILTISLNQDCAIKSIHSFLRVTSISAFSTNFSISCPSVSEVIGFLGKPRFDIENFYQALVIKFIYHLDGIQYI